MAGEKTLFELNAKVEKITLLVVHDGNGYDNALDEMFHAIKDHSFKNAIVDYDSQTVATITDKNNSDVVVDES